MFFIPSLFEASRHYLVEVNHWPEIWYFSLIYTLTSAIPYFGLNIILLIFNQYDLFKEQRIRRPPNTRPASSAFVREAWAYSVALFILMGITVNTLYTILEFRGVDFTSPLTSFSFGTIAYHCVVAMLIEDFLFYWLHRILHHRSIYKYIHKMHHQFASSVGVSVLWAHPIEITLAFVVPSVAGPILLGTPFSILLFWMTLRVWETVDAHSGYTFKWSPWELFQSWQGGAERHDFHHSRNVGSFGSFTKLWDWVHGTDKQFNAWLEKKALLMEQERTE
eukprot:m.91262 g.91262  ORF g.91262 m.91262 type:complete len:278 (+) comp8867_c0_seq1:110-943(+)